MDTQPSTENTQLLIAIVGAVVTVLTAAVTMIGTLGLAYIGYLRLKTGQDKAAEAHKDLVSDVEKVKIQTNGMHEVIVEQAKKDGAAQQRADDAAAKANQGNQMPS